MHQRVYVGIVGLVLVVLGLWGQYEISPENLRENLTTSFYQIIMLFFFSGEWTLDLDVIPLQIEIVRFLAPLAALTSLILVFASATRISLVNYTVHFFKEHIIVVGLGEKSWQFLRTCKMNDSIVVVERDPENLLIHRARDLGLKVLVGDIFEDEMFARINLDQAAELITFTGNDGANIELAIKARNHIRGVQPRARHLKIHIHLNEISLAHYLEGYPKFFADYSIAEVSFFSVYDLSARLLLRDYPPEIFADVAGQARVHLAIYGFQRLAEKLMIEAALMCRYANHSRLRFTIFDEHAEEKAFKLNSEHPYLVSICDFEFIQQSSIGPHIFTGKFAELLPSVTQHIICMDLDEENLNIALMLRATLLEKRSSNAPIMVRMRQSSGLAQLLESNTGGPEIPDGLYPFGMLDQVLHVDNILANRLDKLARSIHEMYLKFQADQDPRSHRAIQAWNDLPEWERKQNLF